MRTCQICSTDNRTQVVWIFNIVQQNKKWILSPLFCQCQHILYLCILISRCISNHSLMSSCL